ncbi:MAG: SGNH/GDSL hydrolase family protein [Rubrivivax sp.]
MSLTAKLMLTPLLVVQALATRARMPRLPEPDGDRYGVVGARGAAPIKLLIVGDSSAAGVGVPAQADALAGRLAERLAQTLPLQVHWRLLARSGITTAQALQFLDAHDAPAADVAVVVTGVNDVVDQIPSSRAVAARDALANGLRTRWGVRHVVFAPLPPVGQFHGLPQPLRWIAGTDADRHNAALLRWAAQRSDVSVVTMAVSLNRGVMASDGFHPGAPVYRYCANAIALHIAALPFLQAPTPPSPSSRKANATT